MEWTIRLEARTGWGEVTTCEIGALRRSLGELTADGVGLGLAEAKALLAELQQRIVQSQIDEYVTCARVCRDCLKLRRLRDQRTRTLQTLFGTVKVAAPRIRLCTCVAEWLRAAGVEQQQLAQSHGVMFVVRSTAVDYHAPARLDDELTISVQVERLGRASVQFFQEAWRATPAGRELLSTGRIKVGCVDTNTLRPGAIPAQVYDRITSNAA